MSKKRFFILIILWEFFNVFLAAEEAEKEGIVVKNAEEALQGARDIIAEIVSDDDLPF